MFPKYKLFLYENRERSKKTIDRAYIQLESKEEQYAKQKTESMEITLVKKDSYAKCFLLIHKIVHIICEIEMPTCIVMTS